MGRFGAALFSKRVVPQLPDLYNRNQICPKFALRNQMFMFPIWQLGHVGKGLDVFALARQFLSACAARRCCHHRLNLRGRRRSSSAVSPNCVRDRDL